MVLPCADPRGLGNLRLRTRGMHQIGSRPETDTSCIIPGQGRFLLMCSGGTRHKRWGAGLSKGERVRLHSFSGVPVL
jgi:hypothetical protein